MHICVLELTCPFLVHLDTLDSHAASIALAPCREPDGTGVPELLGCVERGITPWLVAFAIFEVAVGATNSHVEDQIEVLVEWSIVLTSLRPWIGQSGLVNDGLTKPEMMVSIKAMQATIDVDSLSAIPHALGSVVELQEEDLQQPAVNVHEQIPARPFQSIQMEAFRVVRLSNVSKACSVAKVFHPTHPLQDVLSRSPPESICSWRWAPVKCRVHSITTIRVVDRAVAFGLSNVDLTRLWPVAIDTVLRHHPNCRPKPIALWHLGHDLDATILDALLAFCYQSGTSHRVDDGASSHVASD